VRAYDRHGKFKKHDGEKEELLVDEKIMIYAKEQGERLSVKCNIGATIYM
jgi:hypothetical protein